MDMPKDTINRIVSENLSKLYGGNLLSLEVVGAMPYPLKKDKYVAIYNLRLKEQPPIMLAKIVVNLASGELEAYEPDLL
ncbi:MAG: hypothetical protein ABIJ47_11350 [Candidatus Bathyarchaeota archaeon]